MDAIFTVEFHKIRTQLATYAATAEAREQLQRLMPAKTAAAAVKLLAETEEARRITAKEGAAPIIPLSPIDGAVKRSRVGATLSCAELLRIASVLRASQSFLRYTDVPAYAETYPLLAAKTALLCPLQDTRRHIEAAILDENTIAADASEALAAIRRKQQSTSNKIREILEEIIRSQTYAKVLQEQLVTQRGGRFVVPVRAEQKGALPGVVHDTSQSGSTLFVEPMRVVEANNALQRLAAEEKEEIQRILAALSAEVVPVSQEILENYRILVALDVIFAKAAYGDKLRAVCPQVTENGVVEIRRGRHPLIPADKVVPIDISIGTGFDTLVITGPNTGGKTVSLKTMGLMVLMAAAGLPIPAQEGSKVAVFEKVFADIGDEQSIEQSLSTFSAHMVNIVDILRDADSNTLVLLDELGAGTDPGEGAALATTILQALREKGAKTVATTHYSEIKMYALTTEGVENAACEFDVQTLRPTYRLHIGALGRSNAFAIAAQLGMPAELLDKAKSLITAENTRFEDVISSLESRRKGAEEDREAARQDREVQEKLRRKLEEDAERTEAKRNKILDAARQEARRILQEAKTEIDTRIKEANAAENKKKALEAARHAVGKKLDSVSTALSKNVMKASRIALAPEEIQPGTPVFLEAMGQRGVALRAPDKDGIVEVQVGPMKIKTRASTLSAAPAEKKPTRHVTTRHGGGSAAHQEVDLRGMTLDEAILVTEKFIDDAVLAHLETVTIIHGKGTGVLRSGIQSMLKTHPSVKSYRLGRYGEGEDGVTVVTL
ncbi:MAG: endonuclease MutS2 [Clostridia bacterium]|nr:endonuclease MutS2 [Clostridia bacterium]